MTLAVHNIPTSHTTLNIHIVVEEVLSEWEIPNDKISAVITIEATYLQVLGLTLAIYNDEDDFGEDSHIDEDEIKI